MPLIGVVVVAAIALLTTVSLPSAQQTQQPPGTPQEAMDNHTHGYATVVTPFPTGDDSVAVRSDSTKLNPQQKRWILRAKLEMSKNDAVELAALAKGLYEVLQEPNTNVLSAEVISRTERIQRLARKIREETKGY
jgi:hypothetical protein